MKLRQIDYILGFQGVYFMASAIWPIVQLQNFETLVGYKLAGLQFFTSTLLILVMGIMLFLLIGKSQIKLLKFISFGSSIVFLVIELGFKAQINPLFLIDAFLELVLLMALARTYTNRSITRL